MPRLFSTCLFLIFLQHCCLAQKPVFITVEVGWSDDHYKMNDPGGRFNAPSLGAGLYGIAVRKMISSHAYLETGLYTREYHEGLAFKNELSSSGSGRRFGQIPMRVGGSWGLFKDRVLLRPAAGLALNMTGNYEDGLSWGTVDHSGTQIEYSYKTRYQTQVFFLVQTSFAMELRVGKKTYLGLSSSCNWGLEKILLQEIRYSVNGGPQTVATASTRGGYFSIAGTFSYRFGK